VGYYPFPARIENLFNGEQGAGGAARQSERERSKSFASSDMYDGVSVCSAIPTGENEAVLVDVQFMLASIHRLVVVIIETKRELKAVFITHQHVVLVQG